jgi:DNA-binding response OmpR family regulator
VKKSHLSSVRNPHDSGTSREPGLHVPVDDLSLDEVYVSDGETGSSRKTLESSARLLIIDEDRRRGAQLCSRLVECGYTCRVESEVTEQNASFSERFDLVLLDLPVEALRKDGGESCLERIAGWNGPVVLTSSANVPEEIMQRDQRVRMALKKPYFLNDLVLAVEEVLSSPSPVAVSPSQSGDSVWTRKDRPSARVFFGVMETTEDLGMGLPTEFELDANVVRLQLNKLDGESYRGRVRTMSYEGSMTFDCVSPLPSGSGLKVYLRLVQGSELQFDATATGYTDTTMSVKLSLVTGALPFLRAYVDEVRDISQGTISEIKAVQVAGKASGSIGADEVDQALVARWREVAGQLDDDSAQQSFIQACLKAKKVEFAVQRYRELKETHPGDARVDRYLQQVGTILGFFALKGQAPTVADKVGVPKTIKIALGILVLAVLFLWVLVELLSR